MLTSTERVQKSKVIEKIQCPRCQDSGEDNLAVYDDGHRYCFACHYMEQNNGTVPERSEGSKESKLLQGAIPSNGIPHRCISRTTCEKFDYRVVQLNGVVYEMANYFDANGNKVGQKLRHPDKSFRCVGNMSHSTLFGQNLWKAEGKRIIITEGEIDAMSVYEATEGRVPVVSVPNGAAGASGSLKDNLGFLTGYDEIVLCFDNDEPGIDAAESCCNVIPPGRAYICTLPKKDANDMLVADERTALVRCLMEARPVRPDGVIHVSEVKIESDETDRVYDFPWDKMTKTLFGRRSGELCMHTSGSGMGKTTLLRQMQNFDLQCGRRVGIMMLEEAAQDSMNFLLGLRLGKPVHKIMAMRKLNAIRERDGKTLLDFGIKDNLTTEEYNAAYEALKKEPLFLYDHFGSLECDTLLHKMEYMSNALGCDVIYLDHVSIVISGKESGNERKDIDVLMTRLRSFVERSKVRVEAVCHLTKPDGTPFEEGGQISLRDLRGSGTLYQLSDSVIGYERNQQDQDKQKANTLMVRSLKDRFSGYTGLCTALQFDNMTGRLNEVAYTLDEQGNPLFGVTSDGTLTDEGTDIL